MIPLSWYKCVTSITSTVNKLSYPLSHDKWVIIPTIHDPCSKLYHTHFIKINNCTVYCLMINESSYPRLMINKLLYPSLMRNELSYHYAVTNGSSFPLSLQKKYPLRCDKQVIHYITIGLAKNLLQYVCFILKYKSVYKSVVIIVRFQAVLLTVWIVMGYSFVTCHFADCSHIYTYTYWPHSNRLVSFTQCKLKTQQIFFKRTRNSRWKPLRKL